MSVNCLLLFRHRAINLFLPTFRDKWLRDEDSGIDVLVEDITVTINLLLILIISQ